MNEMKADIGAKTGDALLIIDVQVDFCPGGALAIQEGDQVVPVINEWIQTALERRVPICASRDWHPGQHISFQDEGGNRPPHCLQDSKGAFFHEDLALTDQTVIITKGVRFDKDQHSVFDETGFDAFLKRQGIERLLICGLALDECVLATAMDARKLGFGVHLILDGTRPVDYHNGFEAVEKMKSAGVVMHGSFHAPKPEEKGYGSTETALDISEEIPVCTKAPEWAEHERLEDDDQPCDDGRTGKLDRDG
ncbi:MAG: isochorismatase family protein [Desulfobacterales bacterium]